MRCLSIGLLFLLSAACGGSKPTPDAGPTIDTSCGIDCAAQARFGLLAGTCFEYSDTQTPASPPSLAAEVMPKVELEGGIPVMQVKYTVSGQRRQQDSFTIVKGELQLVRREFGTGGTSVSYKKATGELAGVSWLGSNSGPGQNLSSESNADVISPGARKSESTMYRVTASDPGSDLQTPAANYDAGVRLLFSETPDHGSDSRRVWVPGVGFVLITTPLMLSGGTSQEYRLQKLSNTADGGLCGF